MENPGHFSVEINSEGSWIDHRSDGDAAYQAQIKRLGDLETLWELGDFDLFISRAEPAPSEA